jgi:hypothetical protein
MVRAGLLKGESNMKKRNYAGFVALVLSLVSGMSYADAIFSEDFTGTITSANLTSSSDPLNNSPMLGGFANGKWLLGVDDVNDYAKASVNAANDVLKFMTKRDDSAAAFYTLTSATMGEASRMALTVDLSFLNAHTFSLVVYGIVNPGATTNDAVVYDALNKGTRTFGRVDLGLSTVGTGTASVSDLVSSTNYGSIGMYTVEFDYNGTDDVVLGLTAEMNGTSKRYAEVNSIVLKSIPEPATLGLLAASAGGLLFIRRIMQL